MYELFASLRCYAYMHSVSLSAMHELFAMLYACKISRCAIFFSSVFHLITKLCFHPLHQTKINAKEHDNDKSNIISELNITIQQHLKICED